MGKSAHIRARRRRRARLSGRLAQEQAARWEARAAEKKSSDHWFAFRRDFKKSVELDGIKAKEANAAKKVSR